MSQNASYQKKLVMALVLFAVVSFESCKKYEDGPYISLQTKTKRLAQDWELVSMEGETPIQAMYDENTWVDITVNDYEIEFEFQEDGDFEFNATYNVTQSWNSYYGYDYEYETDMRISRDGEWDFKSDKEELEVDFDRIGYGYGGGYDIFDEREYVIKKLTSVELILETEDGSEWVFRSN